MMIGFALAAVGLDSVTGTLRLTFGFTSTAQGIRLPDRGIGCSAIGEILETAGERASRSRGERPRST